MPPSVLRSSQIGTIFSRTCRGNAYHLRKLHATARTRERQRFDPANVEREEEKVDVCIVGAGPAGLSAAIRLKQIGKESGKQLRVVVLEKGSKIGFYILPLFSRTISNILSFSSQNRFSCTFRRRYRTSSTK